MPIYEYECPKCGHVFEEWGKAAESHKEEPCPVCGTPSPRVISRTSFVLKGDGWYVSDYGYRKGITEDSGSGADTPAPTTPRAPARQGDKSLAKQGEKSVAKQGEKSVAKQGDKSVVVAGDKPAAASGAAKSAAASAAAKPAAAPKPKAP